MLLLFLLLQLGTLIWAQSSAISVADLPQCAKSCLSNSTQVVISTCTSLNVACLCNTPEFVSTFYCCLSTQCDTTQQATAITFNQQQCAAVNATAPDFVGCSPLKASLTSGVSKTVTSVATSSAGSYSTVTSIVSELASYSTTNQVTATFTGQALLTGSCTAPLFALVSASNAAQLFPEVGCAPSRQNCCPFDSNVKAAITTCPQDYFTTAGGCCPSGYQVYTSMLGAESPCYSAISTTLVPASTPSITGLTIITDHVFTRMYPLTTAQSSEISMGALVGIIVVSVAFVIITGAIIFWIRRKKKAQNVETEAPKTTYPSEQPVMPLERIPTSPQELASPEFLGWRSPIRSFWPAGSFLTSPTYGKPKPVPIVRSFTPQELPGSTYINEHHPAFTSSEAETEGSVNKYTLTTPVASVAGSPMVTPIPDDHDMRSMSSGIVSPVGSPRIPRVATDHSIISEKE